MIFEGSLKPQSNLHPAAVRLVVSRNLEFLHYRELFCREHFSFMRRLVVCNAQSVIADLQNNPVPVKFLIYTYKLSVTSLPDVEASFRSLNYVNA